MAAGRRIHAPTWLNRLIFWTIYMIDEQVTEIASLEAPYGKQIVLQNVAYENGTAVLRVRVREGNRFTIFDLDKNTTDQIAGLMSNWSAEGND